MSESMEHAQCSNCGQHLSRPYGRPTDSWSSEESAINCPAPGRNRHDAEPVTVTRVLTEEQFDQEFTLVEFPDGSQTTIDKALMQTYPENRVWALVDDGEGGLCLSSGFAVVNFLGWQVTEEPHPGGNGDIVVEMPAEPYCTACDQPKSCVDGYPCGDTKSGQHVWDKED